MKKMQLTIMVATTLLVMGVLTSAYAEIVTKEECIEKVKAAVKMAVDQGEEEALKQVGDKNGPFVWKDTYVFAITADQAISVAHPITPTLIGKNLLHVKDINGVLIFAEMAKVASSADGYGWVDYMWPKPGEKTPTPKHSYIEKVPGTNVAFGAGYWE
jgi:signal transduction histidine kinase